MLLLDFIHGSVMAVASNVMVLSSIKIGAPVRAAKARIIIFEPMKPIHVIIKKGTKVVNLEHEDANYINA
jgi:hypothetical protein